MESVSTATGDEAVAKQGGYKPRYKRVSCNMQLMDRDIEILKLVHKYRYLTSDHIHLLLPEFTRKGILNRLALLFHNRYLDRPRAQVIRVGNHPLIYGLGSQGAEILADVLDDDTLARGKWAKRNREAGLIFLEHTLSTANFLILAQKGAESLANIRFIDQDEIIEGRKLFPAKGVGRLGWRVEVDRPDRGNEKRKFAFSVVPDGAFALRVKQGNKKLDYLYLLEVDRSTTPITRADFYKSSFAKKLIGYYQSMKEDLFYENFGYHAVRVLTLTRSEQRYRSMIAQNKSIDEQKKGLRIFLFSQDKNFDLKEPTKIFDRVWWNGRGEQTTLFD